MDMDQRQFHAILEKDVLTEEDMDFLTVYCKASLNDLLNEFRANSDVLMEKNVGLFNCFTQMVNLINKLNAIHMTPKTEKYRALEAAKAKEKEAEHQVVALGQRNIDQLIPILIEKFEEFNSTMETIYREETLDKASVLGLIHLMDGHLGMLENLEQKLQHLYTQTKKRQTRKNRSRRMKQYE